MAEKTPPRLGYFPSLQHLPLEDQPLLGKYEMTAEQELSVIFHNECLIREFHTHPEISAYFRSRKSQLEELAKFDR